MTTDTKKETPPNFPDHVELFDVVMLKAGVHDHTAQVDDFRRVLVEASDPLSALQHADVKNQTGYVPLFAVPPGVASAPEIMARRRTMEGSPLDRSKI